MFFSATDSWAWAVLGEAIVSLRHVLQHAGAICTIPVKHGFHAVELKMMIVLYMRGKFIDNVAVQVHQLPALQADQMN